MNSFQKIKLYVRAHKKRSIFFAIIILFVGYLVIHAATKTPAQTEYVLSQVTRGSIISSVSGTGQVAASNEITLTTKASGTIMSLPVSVGQSVPSGGLIAAVDSQDALLELENAQVSYQNLLTSTNNDLTKQQNTVQNDTDALNRAYADGSAALTQGTTDMQDTLQGVKDILDGYLFSGKPSFSDSEHTYIDRASVAYYSANHSFKDFQTAYRAVNLSTDTATIESLIDQATTVATSIAQAVKYTKDAVVYVKGSDTDTAATSAYSSISSLTTSANSLVSDLLSAKTTIQTSKQSLDEATADLNALSNGQTISSLQSGEIDLRSKQKAYDDYFVRAPFDGVLAKLDISKGDTVNSGTTVGTFITKQKIATISLNEIDAAKVSVGQKATLSFDAIPDLTVTGTVAEVDLVGTSSQGVVNYNVKIGFDVQDDRVKSGMSATASIITDSKLDTLTVPSGAVKTASDGSSYVQVLDSHNPQVPGAQGVTSSVAPRSVPVQVGIASDTTTEILSGLSQGDEVISRTVNPSASTASTTSSAPSIFGGSSGSTRAFSGGAVQRGGGATGR